MDPTLGIPLHFAVEAIGLAVAGVILTWAILTRRWLAAIGALAFAAAQTASAGQFADDGAWASVLRMLSAGLIVAGAWIDRPILTGGALAVAAGSLWRVVSDRSAASLDVPPRIVLAAGFLTLAVWAGRRAASSVRTRIVGAFLGVLGIAVVVAGSTAARVGVANAIDGAQSRLNESALSEQRRLAERTQALLSRGALASAVLTQLGPSDQTITDLRDDAFDDVDFALYVDRGGRTMGAAGLGSDEQEAVLASEAVARAKEGDSATAIAAMSDAAALVSATPVFRPGGGRSPSDTVGALVIGDRLVSADLEEVAERSGNGAAAQLVTGDGTLLAAPASAPPISLDALAGDRFRNGEIALDGEDHLAAIARLALTEPPQAAVALTSPVAVAADAAAAFPRALVGGVLAAALLAVVIALWLSSRITRPILNLADEAERVKTEFLSTVSHELRTPLTPIRGYADLLRRERVPRRRQEAYLDEIDEAARRLERIVMLLVEVAAIQAGRFTVEQKPIGSDKLLSDAAARWRRRTRRHEFNVRAPKNLPRINVDRHAITTVLDELLDNAVKFSPEGGSVELRARRENGGVEITVSDQGIGMASEEVERLAAAFVQAEPGQTRRFGGLGLGLTYAAGVLAAHGSRLRVAADPDGGSTFSFTLPTTGMVSRMRDRARSR